MKSIKLRFRPSAGGVGQVLGELESEVMSQLWENPEVTAKEIHSRLHSRNLALTTILTILDRLRRKGLVDREQMGRAFVFRPAVERGEFEAQVTHDVLQGLLKESSRPILNTFVDLVASDEALLDELELLIQKKKK